MTVYQILNKAKAEVGTVESPPNSNNVKYNTWFYGKPVSGSQYPWCAVFVSYIFKDSNLLKKTASCANMLEWCEANNLIVKDPQPGDIIFFKFSTNNRRTNHVGIVESVRGDNINTIEGNTSITSNDNGGKVMQRRRTRKNVVAFARPKYDQDRKTYPSVKKGDHNDTVELLQELLVVNGYNLKVDGIFGPVTEIAVREFQKAHNLRVDGIVGPFTWKELTK